MSYLVQRHGAFWFQIRVPNPLAPRYGKFIRLNLQTTERAVAQPIALQLAGQWLARFTVEKLEVDNAVAQPPSPMQTWQAPVPPLYSQPAVAPQPAAVPHTAWSQPEPGYPVPQAAQQMQQPYGYPPHAVAVPAAAQPQNSAKNSGQGEQPAMQTIDDVFAYWQRMRPDLSKSSYREFEVAVREFKTLTRKPVAALERLDIAAYRDKLIASGLARATVAKKVGFISTLLQVAYDAGHVPQNVARGLRIPKPKVPEVTRRSFTADELHRIFSSPVYTLRKRLRSCGGEALAWVPLIALATGARLEEICQLRVDDITLDPEYGPLIRITDEGEGQMLKTASSRRVIPMHLELERAGLLSYHETVAEQGHAWLFPELEPDHDGRRGGTFGQGFSRYLRSPNGVYIRDKRVVFHSFRHTFKTLCRESGLSEELHDALTGHAGQTVGRTYGHMPLTALVGAVMRIRFPIKFPLVAR